MNVTCHAPCLESSLTPLHMHFHTHKVFVLVLVKVRWTDNDKMLDHHPIFFIWTDSDNIVDGSDKNGGQPSEKNFLFKAMSCIHTQYAQHPHAREMQSYCMVFIYLHVCMHQYHPQKTACYSTKKKIKQTGIFHTNFHTKN